MKFVIILILVAVAATVVGSAATHSFIYGCCGSMDGTYKYGDVIYYEPYTDQEIKEGTLIMYNNPFDESKAHFHRVVCVTDEGNFITRGDAATWIDPYEVEPTDVYGIIDAGGVSNE